MKKNTKTIVFCIASFFCSISLSCSAQNATERKIINSLYKEHITSIEQAAKKNQWVIIHVRPDWHALSNDSGHAKSRKDYQDSIIQVLKNRFELVGINPIYYSMHALDNGDITVKIAYPHDGDGWIKYILNATTYFFLMTIDEEETEKYIAQGGCKAVLLDSLDPFPEEPFADEPEIPEGCSVYQFYIKPDIYKMIMENGATPYPDYVMQYIEKECIVVQDDPVFGWQTVSECKMELDENGIVFLRLIPNEKGEIVLFQIGSKLPGKKFCIVWGSHIVAFFSFPETPLLRQPSLFFPMLDSEEAVSFYIGFTYPLPLDCEIIGVRIAD